MRKATLTRTSDGNDGTFGQLVTDSGFECWTGELPWRENEPNRSCIPEGVYTCTWRMSSKHGMCYHMENVVGRTGVEIHAANFVGDPEVGFKCELLGCIAPGQDLGFIGNQFAVFKSHEALIALETDLAKLPFELTIICEL